MTFIDSINRIAQTVTGGTRKAAEKLQEQVCCQDHYSPANQNLQRIIARNRALRQKARNGSAGGQIKVAQHRGAEPLVGDKRLLLNDSLSLLKKATRGSKDPFFRDLHKNIAQLDQDGKILNDHTRDGKGLEMVTVGDTTSIGCDIFKVNEGTKEGRQRSVVLLAVLLAHEWAHNDRGPKVKGHGLPGRISPYRVQVRVGEMIQDYYQKQGRSQAEIDMVGEVINGSIAAGRKHIKQLQDFPGTGIKQPKRDARN